MKAEGGFSILIIFFMVTLLVAIGAVAALIVYRPPEAPREIVSTTHQQEGGEVDASYFTIETNLNVMPVVYSPAGQEIVGYTHVEDPIAASDGSGEVSGEPLNVFSYPKPSHGRYTVILQGDGDYAADIIIVGKGGDVFTETVNGQTSNGRPDQISIDISEVNRILEVKIAR